MSGTRRIREGQIETGFGRLAPLQVGDRRGSGADQE